MSDDPTTLRDLFGRDQALTEVNALFVPIITAYKLMTNNGVPDENAGAMAQAFGEFVIERHFGCAPVDIRSLLEGDE